MRPLTTTSNTVLGLLSVGDWTGYEIAQLMRTRMGYLWMRAPSGVYAELQSLVDQGLVTSEEQSVGRRRRNRYEITDLGRQALRNWLAGPTARSQFESEAALKMLYADSGTLEDLRAAIAAIETDAINRNQEMLDLLAGYEDGQAPDRARPHLTALTVRLYHEHYAAMVRWAAFARQEIARWPSTGEDAAHFGSEIQAKTVKRFRRLGR